LLVNVGIRQRIFVEQYLIDPNATKAAITADYSKKVVEVTGCKLLRNAKVGSVGFLSRIPIDFGIETSGNL